MTTLCGHACCQIPTNSYHRHRHEPAECEGCATAEGAPVEMLRLGQLVADVLARVVPEIPGLPAGPELSERVSALTMRVAAGAQSDVQLAGLSPEDRHTVLCGRVGVALAFEAA